MNEDRETIIEQLREAGCRITKQRLVILDCILNGDPSCCKEIYAEAAKIDSNIGSATVYRMINTLEEIGVINRKNMYQVDCSNCARKDSEDCEGICDKEIQPGCGACAGGCETNVVVTLSDNSKVILNRAELTEVLTAGLAAQGRLEGKNITRVAL